MYNRALANLQLGDNLAQLQDDLSQDEEPSNFQVSNFDCLPILFHCRKAEGGCLLHLSCGSGCGHFFPFR